MNNLAFTSPTGSLTCNVDYLEQRSAEDGRLLATRASVSLHATGEWAPGWLEVCAEALRQVPYSRAYGFSYRVTVVAEEGDAAHRLKAEFHEIASKRLTA